MTRTFEELIPDLLGARGLTGVPPNIAVFHLRKAAIELCERSHVWSQVLEIDSQSGVQDYPLELPGDAKVVAVREVKIGNCCLSPNRSGLCRGCGCHQFRVEGNHTLWVPESHQDEEQAIKVLVVCKPGQDACNFPEELYEDWSDVIADGAAYRCFAMPKTEWYSAGMVTFYIKKFNVGVTRAKNQRVLQRTTGPLMMVGARF